MSMINNNIAYKYNQTGPCSITLMFWQKWKLCLLDKYIKVSHKTTTMSFESRRYVMSCSCMIYTYTM